MKIIRPYAHILGSASDSPPTGTTLTDWGRGALQRIEWAARISHRSEESQTVDSWRRFLQSVVLDHGDWSVVEHVSVTVDAVVDRGITHEWVRHRIASYTQESTRFVNYERKMPPAFIYPLPEVECVHCLNGVELTDGIPRGSSPIVPWSHLHPEAGRNVWCAYNPTWLTAIDAAEHAYKKLIAQGWRPQEARSVFPNALASRIVTTANLRSWRHFFIMRTTAEAHPQMRQVAIPLLAEFQTAFPLLFDDIRPLARQADNLKLAG